MNNKKKELLTLHLTDILHFRGWAHPARVHLDPGGAYTALINCSTLFAKRRVKNNTSRWKCSSKLGHSTWGSKENTGTDTQTLAKCVWGVFSWPQAVAVDVEFYIWARPETQQLSHDSKLACSWQEKPGFGVRAAQPAPELSLGVLEHSSLLAAHASTAPEVLARLPARLQISASVCSHRPDIFYIS